MDDARRPEPQAAAPLTGEGGELTRRLVEASPMGILAYDAESGRCVLANESAARTVGATVEQLLRQDFRALDSWKSSGLLAAAEATLADGAERRHLAHVATTFGRHVSMDSVFTRFMNAGRTHLLLLLQDVTDLKRAEDQLRSSEERFRSVSTAAIDAIVTMDDRGLVTFWNDAARRMFGWGSEEVLGKNLHDLLAPERYLQAHREAHARFRSTGTGGAIGHVVELVGRRKDGTEFPLELSVSPLRQEDTWHAVGIIRDITERARAEAARAASLERVEDLNLELEEAIGRANRLAAEAAAANAAKSEFLANMSHEIRTPMNGIVGMVHLLEDTSLTPEQLEYATTLRWSADALVTILNNVLDFSKIEAGRVQIEAVDLDLPALLRATLEPLAVQAHAKGLELICHVDPDVPGLLRGDPGRLRQVLTNLAGNAVKFTSRGEVAVRVVLEGEDSRAANLRFTITDTGEGIPADKLPRLFTPFTQADASTTRRFGGTGLGLSISKRLVELMGGRIGATSAEGSGSSFWFTARLEKQPAGLTAPAPGALHGTRVLVADDSAASRRAITAALLRLGCQPQEADDAATALELLGAAAAEGSPFKVALLDAQMTGTDGRPLAAQVRADARLRGLSLVQLSPLAASGPGAAVPPDFDARLAKPLTAPSLLDCLLNLGAPLPALPPRAARPVAARRPGRILLAEDNRVNQVIALKMLDRLGCSVDVVGDGLEALEALRTADYDLVFMDVQMPGLDGFGATAALRVGSGARNPCVPVVAMTAHAMEGDRQRCLDAGMNDYVSKPIEPERLAEVLDRWLPLPAPAAAPPAVPPTFDRAALLARLDGDEALLLDVMQTYVADVPERLRLLEEAWRAGDHSSAARHAHTLRGSSGNLGCLLLQELACKLETTLRAGGSPIELLAELAAAFAALQRELERPVNP